MDERLTKLIDETPKAATAIAKVLFEEMTEHGTANMTEDCRAMATKALEKVKRDDDGKFREDDFVRMLAAILLLERHRDDLEASGMKVD